MLPSTPFLLERIEHLVLSDWHGNEAILIEIASLLFIFAGSQLILEPKFCFFPTRGEQAQQAK